MKTKRLVFLFKLVLLGAFLLQIGGEVLADDPHLPLLNLSGYKKWYYSKLDVSPTQNYFLALDNTLVEGNLGEGPWTENLLLDLKGDVADKVFIKYHLWQLGAIPDRYAFSLNYYDTYLAVGEQNQLINDRPLLSVDQMSGVGLTQKFGDTKLIYLVTDLPKGGLNFMTDYTGWKEFQGPEYVSQAGASYSLNNPELELLGIELGRLDIVAESLDILLDGRKLYLGENVFFDDEFGLVLIPRTFAGAEQLNISFSTTAGEKVAKTFGFSSTARRRAFLSPELRIVNGSEIVTLDGLRLLRGLDYKINYNSGLVVLFRPVPADADVRITYDFTYGSAIYTTQAITGQTGTQLSLAHDLLIAGSEQVTKNGQSLSEYNINYTAGTITFAQALVPTDDLQISYAYSGPDNSAATFGFEQQLGPASKVGILSDGIHSKLSYNTTKNASPGIEAFKYNLYGQTILNKETILKAELALSNYREVRSIFSSPTQETSMALSLSGLTSVGPVKLIAAYKNMGLDFPSVRKVKYNSGHKDQSMSLRADYQIIEPLGCWAGYENTLEQFGSASSPETTSGLLTLGVAYDVADYTAEFVLSQRNQSYSILPSGQNYSQNYLYFRNTFDLDSKYQLIGAICKDAKLIIKATQSNLRGSVDQGVVSTFEGTATRGDIGLLSEYPFGISSYLLWTSENGRDDAALTSYQRSTPMIRLSCQLPFDVKISCFYSRAEQSGSTDYTKTSNGLDLLWLTPIDNPLLTEFRLQASVSSADYLDLNDSNNNYKSTVTRFSGTLVL